MDYNKLAELLYPNVDKNINVYFERYPSRKLLKDAGYSPYYLYRQKYQAGNNENVGWTKKGKACVYNVDVMEETADNLAVGANAISKRVFTEKGLITRFASQKDLKTYLENIDGIIEKKREFFR